MPRFSLREYSKPDYRSSLPNSDPNNAIWPRISMLAKMLNEIPWFKKGDDSSAEEEYRPVQDEASAQYGESRENSVAAEKAAKQMEGYTPDGEDDGKLHAEDLGRDELGFDLQNADKNSIKALQQQLRDGGYDIAVDGVLGGETQAAYDDYNRKLMGAKLYNQNYGDIVGQPENKPFESALDEAEREYGVTKSERAPTRSLPKGADEAVAASGDPAHYEKGLGDDDDFIQYFHGGVPNSAYEEMLRKKYHIGG